jgi:hypothetical protein
MNAYYRQIQRMSDGYAARVFEQLWPKHHVRRAVASFLADQVDIATAEAAAWAVVLDPEQVKLDVGAVQLLHLNADEAWFCVTSLSKELPHWIARTRPMSHGVRGMVYKRVPVPSVGLKLSPEHIAKLPPQVRSNAREYVRQAAARYHGRSAWAYAHSPGVIRFLNDYLGRQLSGGSTEPVRVHGLEFSEGQRSTATVARASRSAAARQACLREYGTACAACSIELSQVYGPTAAGLVHVHHLQPLSTAKGKRQVHAQRDLRPICPNCHAVAHSVTPPLSVQEIRDLLTQHSDPPSNEREITAARQPRQ